MNCLYDKSRNCSTSCFLHECDALKMYNRGRLNAIDECIEKLYEVTPQTVDEKLDMVFVNALRKLKENK